MEALPPHVPAAVPAVASAPDDSSKYWWALGGLVLGLIIMNHKLKKGIEAQKQASYDKGWDDAHENVDKLCVFGQQNRWQPIDIAKVIRGEMSIV